MMDGGVAVPRIDAKTLKLFCAKRGGLNRGSALVYPWSLGNFSYATDGAILIRVKRVKLSPENDSPPQGVEEMINDAFEPAPAHWYPLPAIDRAEAVTIGPCIFSPRRLSLLRNLEVAEIGPHEGLRHAAIRFQGGVGVIAQMRTT
jgi:hypothetical protein